MIFKINSSFIYTSLRFYIQTSYHKIGALNFPVKAYNFSRDMERPETFNEATRIKNYYNKYLGVFDPASQKTSLHNSIGGTKGGMVDPPCQRLCHLPLTPPPRKKCRNQPFSANFRILPPQKRILPPRCQPTKNFGATTAQYTILRITHNALPSLQVSGR